MEEHWLIEWWISFPLWVRLERFVALVADLAPRSLHRVSSMLQCWTYLLSRRTKTMMAKLEDVY